MANTSGINETINCPNGFYFGDPCYALKEDLYQEWLNWGEEREKKEGRWCNDGKFVFKKQDIMIVDSTAYGDGCYGGREMNYGVDAGCLSVIPLEFCDESKNFSELGYVNRKFKGSVTLETDGNDGSFRLRDASTGFTIEYVETGDSTDESEEDDESNW